MDQGRGGLEENRAVNKTPRFWGLRPWKRHSTILAVAGSLYVLVGVQYVITGPSPTRDLFLAAVLQVAPIQVWGGLFVAAGLLAIISARWPPVTETWGYMVLTGLSSGWGATYLTGVVFFHAPITGAGQAIIWGCLGFMWWGVSGLLNPDRTAVRDNGQL